MFNKCTKKKTFSNITLSVNTRVMSQVMYRPSQYFAYVKHDSPFPLKSNMIHNVIGLFSKPIPDRLRGCLRSQLNISKVIASIDDEQTERSIFCDINI